MTDEISRIDIKTSLKVTTDLRTLRRVLDEAGKRSSNTTENVWLTKFQIALLLSLVEQALEGS